MDCLDIVLETNHKKTGRAFLFCQKKALCGCGPALQGGHPECQTICSRKTATVTMSEISHHHLAAANKDISTPQAHFTLQ